MFSITKKIPILGVCFWCGSLLAGCRMEISPEDLSVADQYSGKKSDISVEIHIPDKDLDTAEEGYYLTAAAVPYPFDGVAELFTGLDEATVNELAEESTWEDEDGSIEWSKSITYGDMNYRVGNNGFDFYFSKSAEQSSDYRNITMANHVAVGGYDTVYLNEWFPKQELDNLSSEEAIQRCNVYLESLGYPTDNVDVYTLKEETMNALQKEYKNYDREWTKEEECYLLVYHNQIDGVPLYAPNGSSDMKCYYSAADGLFYILYLGSIWGEVTEKTPVDLITPNQALLNLSAMASTVDLECASLEATDITLGYCMPDYIEGGKYFTPCYKIDYVVTLTDGRQIQGDFLVNAVTGHQITRN